MRIILGAGEGPTSRAYRRRVVAMAAVGLLAVMMGILAQFAQAGSGSAPAPVPAGNTSPGDAPAPPDDAQGRREVVPVGLYATPFVRVAADAVRRNAGAVTVDPMARGRADAPVVMVEYADFTCGYCTHFARETSPEIVRRYVDAGVVRWEFRNFPIRGEASDNLARAAWAAGQQGRFWEFHDAAYQVAGAQAAGSSDDADGAALAYAKAAGVPDLARFAADMAGPAARQSVDESVYAAVSAGAEMTPTFFVNGKKLVGALPNETFFDEIDDAARTARTHSMLRGFGVLF